MCCQRGSRHITPPLDAEYAVFDSAKLGVFKHFTKNISYLLLSHVFCLFWMYLLFIMIFVKMCQPFRFDFVAKLHKVVSRPYLQMVHE